MSEGARRLWDIPTRVLHWILAACVGLNLLVLEEGDDPHYWAGYTAATAVVLRLLWGLRKGGEASRLRALPLHPRSFFRYLRSGLRGPYQGHNPIASWVYVSLWILVLGSALSGWMMGLDAFWGEDWVEELHANSSLGIDILVIVHLLGVAFDSLRYRRHTWLAMLTGRR